MNDEGKIYISPEDYKKLYDWFNCKDSSRVSHDYVYTIKDILSRYTGPELEVLKALCVSQEAINEINKEIGKLTRERMTFEDVADKLYGRLVIGNEFNDILPNEKGEM